MPRENRLKPIQKLAKQEANQRSREVSSRLFHLRTEEQRLEQLQTYLQEYAELAKSSSQTGFNVTIMQSRQDFYRRLKECVLHQQDLVNTLCAQLEDYVDHWNDARTRSMAYEKFAERLADDVNEKAARRDQAVLDEVSQQQYIRQR